MIPDENVVFENEYWVVNHRMNTTYPGYLMVASKSESTELLDLCDKSLASLGLVLAKVEGLLQTTFSPQKVIFSKLGFSKGFNCHFHAVPVSEKVIEEICRSSSYTFDEPDGNDVMLFINREYCEDQDPEKVKVVVSESVTRLRPNS
ncbi:HIT family protein [Vibrio profundi]|uniref:HIT family protein n=1 Tax=Vibrio profundi TaxID=1774960 RepID=UPI00373648E0